MISFCVVVGPLCSGKTTYLKTWEYLGWKTIDIGDVVRQITSKVERTHNKQLDTEILDYLYQAMRGQERIMIGGARQVSVVEPLYKHVKENYPEAHVYSVRLDAPQYVLENRYTNRKNPKDTDLTFQQAIEKDVKLGYNEMITWLNKHQSLHTIPNYQHHEIHSNTVQEG